jgi:hypothetical protein
MMAVDRRSLYVHVTCMVCKCSLLVFNNSNNKYNKLHSMNGFKRHLICEGNVTVTDIPYLPVGRVA